MLIKLKNRNLRFIIEGDSDGAGGGEQAPVIDQSPQTSSQGDQSQQASGNPAWDSVRSELDPISFSKIEPHLKSWDAGVQKRIEQANAQFAPFQPIVKDRQPEYIQKALTYAEQLDADPVRVYQMLGEYLQQNGRLPSAKEAEAALDEQDGDQRQQSLTDPRVDQLAKQQEQILNFFQEQAQQAAIQQADASLEVSLSNLQQAHPELSPEDKQEIIRRAAFVAQQNPGQDIDFDAQLESAYQEFQSLKNRILSTPRPGDSAPQLVPTSGGTPTAPNQQQKSWGQYSNDDIQNFIAGQLAQNKG